MTPDRVSAPSALLWLLVAGGCAPAAPPDDRPRVAVSVAPLRFVVRAVAGERVRVDVMIPPGASPVTYEPTLAQRGALETTALYVKVGHPGFPFEAAWLDGILAGVEGLTVVDASAGVPLREGDPHLWLVPRNVERVAVQVEAALEEILPRERAALRANLEAFRDLAREVDEDVRALLRDAQGAEFFVLHPAWGYFADEYGLRQVAVEREHKEPDPHELAQLIRHARESRARVIFVQPQLDATAARTLARETGARVEVLDPLAEDWDENLRRAARAVAEAVAG